MRGPALSGEACDFLNNLVDVLLPAHQDGLLVNGADFRLSPDLLPDYNRNNAYERDLKTIGAFSGNVVGLTPLGAQVPGERTKDLGIELTMTLLNGISPHGQGLFIFPSFLSAFRKHQLGARLEACDFHVQAVVRAPKRFFPDTSLQPIIVTVGRRKTEKVLFWEPGSSLDVTREMLDPEGAKGQRSLATGIQIPLPDFESFDAWRLQADLKAIGGDYTTFQEYSLADVSLNLKSCKSGEQFTPERDAVYIPLIGNSLVITDLASATIKHQNYAQVIVNAKVVAPEFLANFLNSKYGRALLAYEREYGGTGNVIPKTSLGRLRQMRIKLPPLITQMKICETIAKLTRLRDLVREIEENISINPVSSTEAVRSIDSALESFGRLTEEDHLVEIIRRGESKTVEFKQTLCMETKDGSKQKYISKMVVKTVAAFLNSDGGELFIGVTDEGDVSGVQGEVDSLFAGSFDRYLQHFKSLLKDQIGEQFYPLINYKRVDLKGGSILHVRCERSSFEVFVEGTDFYVRTNPATDKLEGRKMIDYIRQRFKGSTLD